jgi:hypothetical protein
MILRRNGQDALDHLRALGTLADVAAKMGRTEADLAAAFETDPNIWLVGDDVVLIAEPPE